MDCAWKRKNTRDLFSAAGGGGGAQKARADRREAGVGEAGEGAGAPAAKPVGTRTELSADLAMKAARDGSELQAEAANATHAHAIHAHATHANRTREPLYATMTKAAVLAWSYLRQPGLTQWLLARSAAVWHTGEPSPSPVP